MKTAALFKRKIIGKNHHFFQYTKHIEKFRLFNPHKSSIIIVKRLINRNPLDLEWTKSTLSSSWQQILFSLHLPSSVPV
jgi:hypothetical protein